MAPRCDSDAFRDFPRTQNVQGNYSICNETNHLTLKESERFKSFTYEELTKRDKINLDIFWLKDDALEESANLPAPQIIAQDITDDLEAALEQFRMVGEDQNGAPADGPTA